MRYPANSAAPKAEEMDRTALRLAAALLFTAASSVAADEPKLPYTPGLDVTAMDRSANPCVDFYQYSCGGWQKSNPIPADQTSWSVYQLSEDNVAFLRAILEQARGSQGRDAVTQLIGDYYAACMDEAGAENVARYRSRASRCNHGGKTASSSLKFDSFWASLDKRKHFDPVERATSDYFSRGGVRTPRNPSALTTALRFSTNC